MFNRYRYGQPNISNERFGELGLPNGHRDRPLIVLIHGGFWRDQYHLDLMYPLARDLHDRGYATWNIEYRRVGPTGGGWDTTTADVAAAIDHLPRLAEQNTTSWRGHVVVGHSAGGHLALWNASRTGADPRLTVALAPVADVIEANRNGVGVDATINFVGGNHDDVPDRYAHVQPDPTRFVGRVITVHGTADDNVPVEQSTSLAPHIDQAIILDDVDHFHVIDPTHHSWEPIRTELARLHHQVSPD